MTPLQALEILVFQCKQASVPFGAHLQAQQAADSLLSYIQRQQGDAPAPASDKEVSKEAVKPSPLKALEKKAK